MRSGPQHSEAEVTPSASESWSIRLDDVSVTYPNGTTALRGISLDITPDRERS
jgi:phosphonate transport system ATP-binding protein